MIGLLYDTLTMASQSTQSRKGETMNMATKLKNEYSNRVDSMIAKYPKQEGNRRYHRDWCSDAVAGVLVRDVKTKGRKFPKGTPVLWGLDDVSETECVGIQFWAVGAFDVVHTWSPINRVES